MLPSVNGRFLRLVVAQFVVALLCAPAWAEDSSGREHWVTAWGTSQQPNVTAVSLSNATIRMIARVTIPGDTIRIRLDNTFSSVPATIGRASVGHRVQGALLAAGSSQQVHFNGSPSVTIPAGGSVQSDPIALTVHAWQDIAVSLYVPDADVHPSQHGGAVVTSYLTASDSGDATADETRTPFTKTTTSMYWLKSIDVLSSRSTSAVVAFGDSITDGTCTTLDAHDRWEDWVSIRLDLATGSEGSPRHGLGGFGGRFESEGGRRSIVNEGIGGNTITRDNLQPPPDSTPGLERLDRDVLSHAGVSDVVLFMGTNDIRREASAAQVIAGMQNIIQRVRAKGLKIYGVTIVPRHNVAPSGTNTGWNPAKTAIRNEVNRWIRTEAPFDGILDFDKVVRQPANPDLLIPAFNCGDGIHPSPAGYYQLGKSVDLDLFAAPDR
jgi:lysophospholipase L1-like esterase